MTVTAAGAGPWASASHASQSGGLGGEEERLGEGGGGGQGSHGSRDPRRVCALCLHLGIVWPGFLLEEKTGTRSPGLWARRGGEAARGSLPGTVPAATPS